jgi:hypothetical protein
MKTNYITELPQTQSIFFIPDANIGQYDQKETASSLGLCPYSLSAQRNEFLKAESRAD